MNTADCVCGRKKSPLSKFRAPTESTSVVSALRGKHASVQFVLNDFFNSYGKLKCSAKLPLQFYPQPSQLQLRLLDSRIHSEEYVLCLLSLLQYSKLHDDDHDDDDDDNDDDYIILHIIPSTSKYSLCIQKHCRNMKEK